jgi:type 1 glutamine amidotransferase
MTRGKTGQAASALAALLLMAAATTATEPLRVLILSGANNHDWKSTTPVLRQLVETCPRFKVIDVIEDPSQVTAELLNRCDVIASNWSAYPEMAGHQWGEKAERDFVDWVKAGHGFVVFHAASATSQDWPAFQQLVKLTWGIDKTSHGAYHTLKVTVRDSDHPITRGMRDFWITDELWHNMVNLTGQEVRAVCEAFSEPDFGGTGKFEPVVVPTALGEGRGLNIVLGHDARAMKNIGWQTLMLRGLEWAATGDVTIPIPEDWPQTAAAALITGLDLDAAIQGVAAYRDGQAREPLGLVQQWGEALRSALSSTQGLPRLGVIHSLGQLRDSQSAALLINLLGDNDVQVAGAAALALGELGTVACADALMKDEAVREAAAEAAARIGQDLAASEREVVKLTMQQVIAVSRNVDTIKLADAALREAARSVNLARNATVSSPDGLEPDGGLGPDAAAVDGNLATYWDETDDQPLYRFQVSFAKPTKVNTVVIIGHAYQSHIPKEFEVLCDNKVVKSVYDVDTGREPTSYVPLPAGPRQLSWRKDESSLALLNYSRVVWALHYGRETAKPYFDPLGLIDGVSLVWNSPPDHPWHHGLWFSWKGINGVNYWEEDGGTGRAEGLTEVVSAKVSTRDDFSARVELDLAYHQPDEPPVLRETRIMNISAPDEQGGYTIDWRGTFQAANQDLLLQGGTAGGGYAGLSARIAGDTRDWRLMDGDGREDVPGADPLAKNLHGQHARWMDLSLVHVGSGQAAGLAILEHPTSLRHPTQWHCVLEDKIPFGYFSPSPLWSEPYTLKAGGKFVLAYQVVVHPQRLSGAELERRWKEFAQGKE